jgi:hypothetical protein
MKNTMIKYIERKACKDGMNIKNKYIRNLYKGISGFKKRYEPRAKIIKDKKDKLLADSHCIANEK